MPSKKRVALRENSQSTKIIIRKLFANYSQTSILQQIIRKHQFLPDQIETFCSPMKSIGKVSFEKLNSLRDTDDNPVKCTFS